MEMDRSEMLFYVPAVFTTLLTVGVGCFFLVTAWAQVLLEPPAEAPRAIEMPLLAFTVAVLLDVITLPVLLGVSDAERSTVWLLLVAGSFALAIASRWLVRQSSAPGRRMVKIGSILLMIIDFIGLLGVISGLPSL
jgi:hypothetical protein